MWKICILNDIAKIYFGPSPNFNFAQNTDLLTNKKKWFLNIYFRNIWVFGPNFCQKYLYFAFLNSKSEPSSHFRSLFNYLRERIPSFGRAKTAQNFLNGSSKITHSSWNERLFVQNSNWQTFGLNPHYRFWRKYIM